MKKITEKEYNILFPNGASDDWVIALNKPDWEHKVYYKNEKPYGIVVMGYDKDGVLMMNSGTVDNQPFTFGMRRVMLKAAKTHGKFVVHSTQKNSSLIRYGSYNDEHQCFYKGL